MELENLDLKVVMIQMEITNSPRENAERFLHKAREAARCGADIIVGSEMMLAPYIRGDSYEDDEFLLDMVAAKQYIVRESERIDAVLIFGGISIAGEDWTPRPRAEQYFTGEDGRRQKFNVAFIAHNGTLVGNSGMGLTCATKTLLPNYRIFDDSRYFFDTRKQAEMMDVDADMLIDPFPVIIRGREYKLGVMLCEDMWDMDYHLKPAQILAENGADILINLSCSPWTWQKNRKRDHIIKAICQKTGLPFVYVNNVGCQNNGKNFIVFDGSSTAYDNQGNIIAMSVPYIEESRLVNYAQENPTLLRVQEDDVAAMYLAITIATKGFLKTLPSHLRKVVVGVSGGIDSALSVAFFAYLLGPENVIGVNMPYKHYNAAETKDDAAEICRRLGVEYRVVPIDEAVDAVASAAGVEPGTSQHKTIQASARLQMLVGIAAAEGAWFPSNSNWAELFFGYGTLNGDLRGTFSPWANCLKQDVYRLAHYLNTQVFREEVIPQSIIDRPPMDELVAEGAGERSDPFNYGSVTDNGYHDQMVRSFVVFRRGPEWFIEKHLSGELETELMLPEGLLNKLFANNREWLADLKRCFALYYNNIFKHVQSVPAPLIDKRSFGWDFRESIGVEYETERFKALEEQLLAQDADARYWPKQNRIIPAGAPAVISRDGGKHQEFA